MIPIEQNTDGTMRDIADYIESQIGEDYGFMVLVAPFKGGPRTAHYISNVERETMIAVLREKADVLERKLDIQVEDEFHE